MSDFACARCNAPTVEVVATAFAGDVQIAVPVQVCVAPDCVRARGGTVSKVYRRPGAKGGGW